MSLNNRHRPKYHFTAEKNWINDPNGLVHWKGNYHLYYQHNPAGAYWDDMHWGHAVSKDMLTWEHLPIAFYPDREYDQSGVYSGMAIQDGDEVLFYYTGVNGDDQLPCLAVASDDLLLKPDKVSENPLFYPPEGIETVIFRDHSIVSLDNFWYQVIGSGIEGETGNCMLYRSEDLRHWEFVGPLVKPEHLRNELPEITGWECPDFFQIGDTWVLVVSHWNEFGAIRVWAYTGTFDGTHFVPKHGSIADAGQSFYAPQGFNDETGRRIQFGWLRESRPVPLHSADGWAGAMSLPREMTIRDDGTLGSIPAKEVMDHLDFFDISGDFADENWSNIDLGTLSTTSNVLRLSSAGELNFELELRRSPQGEEVTTISATDGSLTVDTTTSTTHDEISGEAFTTPIGTANEVLIFIDESVVEIFVDEQAHVVRIYPERDDSAGIRLRTAPGVTLEASPFDVTFSSEASAN